MQRMHLWPAHAHNEPRFRCRGADFDVGSEVEDRLDVDGQRLRYRRRPHLLNESPAVGRQPERNRSSHANCPRFDEPGQDDPRQSRRGTANGMPADNGHIAIAQRRNARDLIRRVTATTASCVFWMARRRRAGPKGSAPVRCGSSARCRSLR
jgi:hypothetical protein